MVPMNPTPLDQGRIRQALGSMVERYALEIHGQLASTNDRAAELAQEGYPPGQVVLAESQTSGRGRRGKVWQSPAGGNIYLSLLIPEPPRDLVAQVLPLAAAVAFASALEEYGLTPALKWPNDLVTSVGRKFGGILMEAIKGKPMYILGLGLNVVEAGDGSQGPEASRRTCLAALGLAPTDREHLIGRMLEQWAKTWRTLETWGWRPVQSQFLERAWLVGEQVTLEGEGGRLIGTYAGISERGCLLLDQGSGPKPYTSGELSLRVPVGRP